MGTGGGKWDAGDVGTAARLNQKTVKTDTGANINAETKYAGQICLPTSSNGSLTADILAYVLSDGTTQEDIVAKTQTQTITNKTINATNNTITDTSTAAEDLLKSNGTKFLRFAKGSNYNHLRVNGSGNLEYDEIFGNELARTELNSSDSSISVTPITAKKQLFVIAKLLASGVGSVIPTIRFNNDSGANYAYRYSTSGGAEITGTSATSIAAGGGVNSTGIIYLVIHILNESAKRKLVWIQYVDDLAGGAASVPVRTVIAGKWDNTSAQITRIDVLSTNLDTGSRVVVFGLD